MRFEHTVRHRSLMTTYMMLLAELVQHSLVNWYQQYVTVHHVPNCMSCHKAIVVITGRAHSFHDNRYITLILLLWDLSTLYVVDHLWPLIYIYIIYIFISFIFLVFYNTTRFKISSHVLWLWCIKIKVPFCLSLADVSFTHFWKIKLSFRKNSPKISAPFDSSILALSL